MKWAVKLVKIGLMVAGTVAVMVGTVLGAVWVSQADTRRAEASAKCPTGGHSTYKAAFKNDKVVPSHITAKRCDMFVITNLDNKPRFLTFGPHNSHQSYAGVTERYLAKDSSLELTLVKAGTFRFHDHIRETAQGGFTVEESK